MKQKILTFITIVSIISMTMTGCGDRSSYDSSVTNAVSVQKTDETSVSVSKTKESLNETENEDAESVEQQEEVEKTANVSEDKGNVKAGGDWRGFHWELTESGHFSLTGEGDDEIDWNHIWVSRIWRSYTDDIISAYVDISGAESLSQLFEDCHNLQEVDLSNLDTSSVTSMESMFEDCNSLKRVDLSNFDTSNVTDMSNMFRCCESLEEVNLSSFDTSSVTDMFDMFSCCRSLKNIDLSSFNTANAIIMGGMFSGLDSLETLDISSFDTSSIEKWDPGFTFWGSASEFTVYVSESWAELFQEKYQEEYPGINIVIK